MRIIVIMWGSDAYVYDSVEEFAEDARNNGWDEGSDMEVFNLTDAKPLKIEFVPATVRIEGLTDEPAADGPIDLRDTAAVYAAARKAYAAGELQAQKAAEANEAPEKCLYAGPCGIGAAIPPERRAELDEGDETCIAWLISEGKILSGDESALERLQVAHDNWANSIGKRYNSPEYVEAKHQEFVRVLMEY